jgi:hypothetical protein
VSGRPAGRRLQVSNASASPVAQSPRAGATAVALGRLPADRRGFGRGSDLAGAAIDPQLCRSHKLPRPGGRLPLRQEPHKLGADATSPLVRTSSESATTLPVGFRILMRMPNSRAPGGASTVRLVDLH